MERNPESMQEFYKERELKEAEEFKESLDEIAKIEKEMKSTFDIFQKELNTLIDKISKEYE